MRDPSRDRVTARVVEALEQAAMAGLCREGRIEIAAGAVRALRPDLGPEEALALATAVHDAEET